MKRAIMGMTAAVLAWAARGAEGPALQHAPPQGFVFAAEGCGKILRFGADGRVAWECPAPMARDVWVLPGGNVLFPYNEDYDARSNGSPSGVREVAPDGRVVFQFATTGQVFSCQRMADGSTLVGAASQGKLLVVSPAGAIVREVRVKNAPGHSCMRNARALAGGGFLVAEESAKAAREYAADGALVREFPAPFPVYSAVRLADGGTLICGKQGMVGFDRDARPAWSLDASEFPTLGIRWFAGVQALDDGTVFVCNAGGAVPFFVLNPRTKRILWQSHDGKAGMPIGHGIHLPGAADPGRK